MKNIGNLLGLVGVMTLLFSFSAISQEKRIVRAKMEYVQVKKPLVVKKVEPTQNMKMKVIKREVHSKYIINRLKATDAVHQRKLEPFRKPLRYKK